MNILIATAGALAPDSVADLVAKMLGEWGKVTTVTVVEVPRSFLTEIRSEEWRPLASDDEPTWPDREDAVIARYVEERGRKLTEPLVAALESRGIVPTSHYREGEDAAAVIINAAQENDADLIVMGATRQLFNESAWESVSGRVIQNGTRPVVVIPPGRMEAHERDDGS